MKNMNVPSVDISTTKPKAIPNMAFPLELLGINCRQTGYALFAV